MKRLVIGGLAALAWVGLATAPVAGANSDASGFLVFLENHGEPSGNAEIAGAQVDLGNAICNLYNASQSHAHVHQKLLDVGHSPVNASVWEIASVHFLCPQFKYLLPI
jgi:Protein of unknown function (DUF732)